MSKVQWVNLVSDDERKINNIKYKLHSLENESTRLAFSWRLERKLNI